MFCQTILLFQTVAFITVFLFLFFWFIIFSTWKLLSEICKWLACVCEPFLSQYRFKAVFEHCSPNTYMPFNAVKWLSYWMPWTRIRLDFSKCSRSHTKKKLSSYKNAISWFWFCKKEKKNQRFSINRSQPLKKLESVANHK